MGRALGVPEIFPRRETSPPYATHTATPRRSQDLATMRRAEQTKRCSGCVFLVAQVFAGWECDNELMHKASK